MLYTHVKLDEPAVSAVGLLVAEELDADALPVAALQLPVRAHRLLRVEVRLHKSRLRQTVAVVNLGDFVAHSTPVAFLFILGIFFLSVTSCFCFVCIFPVH